MLQDSLGRIEIGRRPQTEGDEIGKFSKGHHKHGLHDLLIVVTVGTQYVDIALRDLGRTAVQLRRKIQKSFERNWNLRRRVIQRDLLRFRALDAEHAYHLAMS